MIAIVVANDAPQAQPHGIQQHDMDTTTIEVTIIATSDIISVNIAFTRITNTATIARAPNTTATA